MKAKLISQISHKGRVFLHTKIPLKTPLVVFVESSGFCNLKCKFCPHGTGENFKKDLMSIKLFEKLVKDLSIFPDKLKLLRFCGDGDSLVNKNIVQFTQLAKEKKIAEKVEMITNGVLLHTDLIKNLPRFLDRIIISIEGLNTQDYQRISGTKIDYQRFLDNLHALYTNKNKCKIHIKINNEAVSSDKKKVKFFNMFGDICDEINIENLVSMWPQFKTSFSTNQFRFGGKVIKRQVCAQIFKSLQVQADGEVVPCCVDWNRVNLLGNIKRNSLLEIWNGKKIRNLQIKHLQGKKGTLETCKDCSMNDYCDTDNIDLYRKECLKRLSQHHEN